MGGGPVVNGSLAGRVRISGLLSKQWMVDGGWLNPTGPGQH